MTIKSHKYKHLSSEECIIIETLLSIGYGVRQIAKKLNRARSTIYNEIKRCKYVKGYQSKIAQTRRKKAKNESHKHRKINYRPLLVFMERHLKQKWSPEVIAAKWSEENPEHKISHTSIYNYIKKHRPEWNKYLIYKGNKKNKRQYNKRAGVNLIPNRTDLSERPEDINKRERIGDFEADTVLSSRKGKSCIAVFVERKTRIVKFIKMKDKSALEMEKAAIKGLVDFDVKTITYDNGTENVRHDDINKALGCQSYFCRAYRSCDKGSVENRNKILRQFYPKKTNFDLITDEELAIIENKINNRPLKVLNWLSPIQAYQKSIVSLPTLI